MQSIDKDLVVWGCLIILLLMFLIGRRILESVRNRRIIRDSKTAFSKARVVEEDAAGAVFLQGTHNDRLYQVPIEEVLQKLAFDPAGGAKLYFTQAKDARRWLMSAPYMVDVAKVMEKYVLFDFGAPMEYCFPTKTRREITHGKA